MLRFKIQPWAVRLGEPKKTVNKIYFGKVKTRCFPRKNGAKFILDGMETGRGKAGKLTASRLGMAGKTGIAKGYLGLQGTWHEREAMGKGEGALSGRKVMEGDFKRNGTEPINSNVQSFTGRLDDI